ncbi:hypothetical protein L596_024480 [Steinernema carpocapsae]|uniref:Uncharacterized protein n=1 Tax=Steinernema carpocapsae TaxID=34508 RepID=A0A4V5ZZQ6_STECR|nr:hypothetical protein L596_024480 [Steinernema carpocapsae]
MPGATAVVTTVALQMDLSLANISAAGKAHRVTPFTQSAYLQKGQHTCKINEPGFKEAINLSAVTVWILSRAVGQSNVSKEASNPS